MPDPISQLDESALSLEDQFFHKEDRKLIEKLKEMKKMNETIEALEKASGIKNREVLIKLVGLNIHPEMAAALAMVPVIEVAWADGKVDKQERDAILKGAEKAGYARGSIDYDLLDEWLMRRPPQKLMDAWLHYVHDLREQLSASELASLKREILDHARAVAWASGGIMGLGSKISPSEDAMLLAIAAAFD